MIRTKRDSLEKFIQQQMEGPGACNNQFYCEGDDETEEVLNTTPGSVYSTAVLFPQRKQADPSEQETGDLPISESESDSDSDSESDSNFQESKDDNTNEDQEERANRLGSDEEDLYSLSQRFPTKIGLSCCIDKDGHPISDKDLRIFISGRYYTKISKANYTDIVIRISDDDFTSFYNAHIKELSPYFSLTGVGLKLASDISKNLSKVKDLLLSINKNLCAKVATNSDGALDQDYLQIGNNYRYLKSYKEKLWSKLHYVRDGEYITNEQKTLVESRMKDIEKYETYLSYLEDAMNICNSQSFGFWRSHSFCKNIDLARIDFNKNGNKIIYSPKDHECLNILLKGGADNDPLTLKLSVWIQITKSSKDTSGKKYLKIQVENTSTPFKEDSKHYFSIVTEQVNERCFFGINLKVESEYLSPYQERRSDALQEDIEQLNYLYRSTKDYAVGHSCSADWSITAEKKWVKTEFLPSCETPDVEAVPRDKYNYEDCGNNRMPKPLLTDTQALQFKWLSTFSDAKDEEIIDGLKSFTKSYQDWITTQRSILDSPSEDNRIGYANLAKCEEDCNRIASNITDLLEADQNNLMSFRLMNSAMFIQLWHSKEKADKKTSFDFYKDEADDKLFGNFPATWRPFQLAFILLNLDGLIQHPNDPNWEKRNELVDLVWFPTGGGKTEAYLGIIALSIIIRRRTGKPNSGGTTAIMRYTLRLLATQQFQRAMRVILALEQIRQWGKSHLGDEPISIGLFVGENSLPNTSKKLLEECLKWAEPHDKSGRRKESKIPLDMCPCCGEPLEYQNLGTPQSPKIVFRCQNPSCTFGEALPVVLCDEDIYQKPPTLLFGTVDKFASLAHKVSSTKTTQDSRRLFGLRDGINNLPPSLIIQDELHLLLGPLGSAVSLFECAIDQLCSYKTETGKNVRPKIISSTATTRNTPLQIRALYDRDVNIFPKSGIDYDDSFFAFYQRDDKHFVSKRKYLGVFPTGRTHMTTQMRLVATIFVHRALFEKEYTSRLTEPAVEQAMDYYHSVIDYFNSLKEVGKTDAQFFTEFTKYTRRLFKRVLRYSNNLECLYGYDSSFNKSELTGRLTGAEVVKELDAVSTHWKAKKRFPHKDPESGEWIQGSVPPDLILATNMISVGLDVDRFNTIIMNSMPRNIAEYIQASSRVARNEPGLVITLHNPFQARDLSHFERFREFHEKLYYYVEPISITPFSKKSVNKYLPLYLATMIRHRYPELANSENAAHLTPTLQEKIKADLTQYFRQRLTRTKELSSSIKELLTTELESYIEHFLDDALKAWQSLVDGQSSQNYSLRYSGSDYINNNSRSTKHYKDLFLALDAYQDDETSNWWSVPMSLRTVESEAVINIKDK